LKKGFHGIEETGASMTDGTLHSAHAILESLLRGSFRKQFIDELLGTKEFSRAMNALRSSMKSHTFKSSSSSFSLGNVIKILDDRTKAEGFEVFHSWNHSDHTFSNDSTPVLMVDHFARMGLKDRDERSCFSLLLDVYFFHVLALCCIRSWDDDQPQENFDKITRLLGWLQGPSGSGHQFVGNAETLLVMAISQYHPIDQAYDALIARIWSLDSERKVRFSLISASVLGGHLRWGSRAMYSRDVVKMRADNEGDYPWLLYSLTTLMQEYVRLRESGVKNQDRQEIVKALLNGLTPDPWAFFQMPPPASLALYSEKHQILQQLLVTYAEELATEFTAARPRLKDYSSLAFHFNFPHNILNALLMVCLSEGSVQSLSLSDLLLGAVSGSPKNDELSEVALKLVLFASSSRDKVGPQGTKLIIYDPHVGLAHCNMVLSTMKKYLV
jgi:hypothetical protein